MKIRAAIFDVYTTILEVGPPPTHAEALWTELSEEMLGNAPAVSRTEFSVRAARIIERQHAAARKRGIQWPEILWPWVALEAIPELRRLSASQLDEFLFRQMQLSRTLRLADGVSECLCKLQESGVVMGIASNAQAYTLKELSLALQGSGVGLAAFDAHLRFWSFEHGFSKPDPHVFCLLGSRLEARGISAPETLMVGDRIDNDILPAREFGWQTWQLAASRTHETAGSWHDLLTWLKASRL